MPRIIPHLTLSRNGRLLHHSLTGFWLEKPGIRAIVAKNADGKKVITGYEIRAAKGSYTPDMEAAPDTSNLTIRSEEVLAALKRIIANSGEDGQGVASLGRG